MNRFQTNLLIVTFSFLKLSCFAQSASNDVIVVGAMRNVMWKGQLQGSVAIDTLIPKKNLYGFGPLENLFGELLIIDGHSYQSRVTKNGSMNVVESFHAKAPFFAYAHIENWKEQPLPDSILDLNQLENYLIKISTSTKQPFLFKLEGDVDSAVIHLVNLAPGSTVHSPNDAHKGQQTFTLQNSPVEIIGFFSTAHKAIFTHHDTFLHMHLITKDRKKMGHLDVAHFKQNAIKLYLPQD